jgi:hypothetical protein
MHFRIRGNNVQLVKTVADPESGKAKSAPVGSVNLLTGKINERALEALSSEEVVEVETWLDKKRDLDQRKRQLEAETLPLTLSDVATWINEADRSAVAELAEEIQFGMAEVRRALTAKLRD